MNYGASLGSRHEAAGVGVGPIGEGLAVDTDAVMLCHLSEHRVRQGQDRKRVSTRVGVLKDRLNNSLRGFFVIGGCVVERPMRLDVNDICSHGPGARSEGR